MLVRYNKFESKMRIRIDEGTVLKKRHLLHIPRHEEFKFNVDGFAVLLTRDSRPQKGDGKFSVFTVFIEGNKSAEFSG